MNDAARRTVSSLRDRCARAGKLLLGVSLATCLAAAPAVAADVYDDGKDTNPLRVVSYVLHPVGKIVEWTVFRPLHAFGRHLAPDAGLVEERAHHCNRERPSRSCTDVIQ